MAVIVVSSARVWRMPHADWRQREAAERRPAPTPRLRWACLKRIFRRDNEREA